MNIIQYNLDFLGFNLFIFYFLFIPHFFRHFPYYVIAIYIYIFVLSVIRVNVVILVIANFLSVTVTFPSFVFWTILNSFLMFRYHWCTYIYIFFFCLFRSMLVLKNLFFDYPSQPVIIKVVQYFHFTVI